MTKTNHSPQGQNARRIIATEPALSFLINFQRTHSQSLRTLLSRLSTTGAESEVFHIHGSSRPIWKFPITDREVAFCTIGISETTSEEVRIIFAGPASDSPSLIEIADMAGEIDLSSNFITGEIIAHLSSGSFPSSPAAFVTQTPSSLSDYLSGTLHQHHIGTPESLNGRKFRVVVTNQTDIRTFDLHAPDDFPLRLSPQQYELLDAPRPLLIQGVAGSGKTTVVVHASFRRFIEEGETCRILVVAYQNTLKHYISALIASLAEGKDRVPQIEVHTFQELCDHLASYLSLPSFSWVKESDIMNSLRLLRKEAGLTNKIRLPELLEEIRACLKGCSLDSNTPLVPLVTYASENRNHLHFSSDAKLKAYEIAQKHQAYLRARDFQDEMDAAQRLLSYSAKKHLPQWDHVFVDEVQDYTLVQLAFLSSLSKTPEGLVFAGDEHQVVRASQFSWSRVTEALQAVGYLGEYHRFDIQTNYRNTVPIIDFSHALLQHRAERLRVPTPSRALTNQPLTPPPLRIVVRRKEYAALVASLAEQIPSLGVIYPTDQEVSKNKWKLKTIAFRRGFSPQSVKGLEFEAVCLVGFGHAFSDLTTGQPFQTPATEMFRFNQVYVSLTRPRRLLILIDTTSNGAQLWDEPRYKSIYKQMASSREIASFAIAECVTSDESSWSLSAMDFERQEAFAPAAECWQRAGLWKRAATCFRALKEWDEAITCYLKVSDYREAATLLEHLSRHAQAAELWSKTQRWDREAYCWERLDRYDLAVIAWEKTGDARNTLNAKAILAESQRDYAVASKYWATLESFDNAAECAEKAFLFEDASNLWKNAGKTAKALRAQAYFLEQRELYSDAAELWITLHDYGKGAAALEHAGRFQEAHDLWNKINDNYSAKLTLSMLLEASGEISAAVKLRIEVENSVSAVFAYHGDEAIKNEQEGSRQLRYFRKTGPQIKLGGRGRHGKKVKHVAQQMRRIPYYRFAIESWQKGVDELTNMIDRFSRLGLTPTKYDYWLLRIDEAQNRITKCLKLENQ